MNVTKNEKFDCKHQIRAQGEISKYKSRQKLKNPIKKYNHTRPMFYFSENYINSKVVRT